VVAEPARTSSGYREYDVADLARIARIAFLSDSRVPLREIAALLEPEVGDPATDLAAIRDGIDQRITTLTRQRDRLDAIAQRAAAGLPPGLLPEPVTRALDLCRSEASDDPDLAALVELERDMLDLAALRGELPDELAAAYSAIMTDGERRRRYLDLLAGVFYKDRSRKSGYQSKCRDCMRTYVSGYSHDVERVARKRNEAAELKKRDLKVRGTCGQLKNRDSFNRRSDSPDQLHTSCRACCARASRASFEKRLAADPYFVRLQSGRKRAEAAGHPAEWFTSAELFEHGQARGIDPWVCVWTGEKLTPETVQWDHLIALSDHRSPGHVMHNLRPASASANSAKGRRHFVEFLADRSGKPCAPQSKV